MQIKQAVIFLVRQVLIALGFLLLGYVVLEWIMPGSVLPFVDVIDLLPAACILFFFAALTIEHNRGWRNYIWVAIGLIMSAILIFILWAKIDGYSLKNLTLAASATICLAVWLRVVSEP